MINPFEEANQAMIECYEANQRDYRAGLLRPNYPVPATRSNAITATSYVSSVVLIMEYELTPLAMI